MNEHIENIPTIYGTFVTREGDLITDQLKQYSAHTRNEIAMLKSFIKPGDNIIDIGAHIGTYSIPFAIFNKRAGKIFSFEADKGNYNLLCENIKINSMNGSIVPIHAIISNDDSPHIRKIKCTNNTGTYYFLPVNHNKTDEDTLSNIINIDRWIKNQQIKIPFKIIKIDIEGSEMSALISCRNTIKKYLPILYIEINTQALDRFSTSVKDIEEFLLKFGYHFFKNTGPRNSTNDTFTLLPLDTIEQGGAFFDVLAIHPDDERYPRQFAQNNKKNPQTLLTKIKNLIRVPAR